MPEPQGSGLRRLEATHSLLEIDFCQQVPGRTPPCGLTGSKLGFLGYPSLMGALEAGLPSLGLILWGP